MPTDDAAVISRFNRGAREYQDSCKAAFGHFCDELERLNCPQPMTPSMLLLGKLIGKATLKLGRTSMALERLESLIDLGKGERLVNLQRNDLSLALNGRPGAEGEPRRRGLADLGIVRFEPMALENARGWVLLVNWNSALWQVDASEWRFTAEQEQRWRVHVLSEWQRCTPFMRGLAPEPDLYDALATPGMANQPVRDTAGEPSERRSPAVFLTQNSGARDSVEHGRKRQVERAGWQRCSESQNNELPKNIGESPPCSESQNEPEDLRLKLKTKDPKLKLRSLKEALYVLESTTDDDEVRKALCVILGESAGENDAGKWIVRRWNEPALVIKTMTLTVEDLTNHRKIRRPGGVAERHWQKLKGKGYGKH